MLKTAELRWSWRKCEGSGWKAL